MNYEKLSPALAALVFEYLRFSEATIASVNGTRPQPPFISAENKLQTILEIYCNAETQIENTKLLNYTSDGSKILTAQIELDGISDLTERIDVHYLSCPIPEDSLGNEKKIVVAPGKFTPARVAFVVPSNSQPGSPHEVVLRGWFAAEANCEITILSPGGGTTRSAQAEVINGNPTRFGNYHSSQAFLTKPKLTQDGRKEFFINMRPIAPQQFVTGGTWKLTVVNVGNSEVKVKLKSWVAGDAKNVNFI